MKAVAGSDTIDRRTLKMTRKPTKKRSVGIIIYYSASEYEKRLEEKHRLSLKLKRTVSWKELLTGRR